MKLTTRIEKINTYEQNCFTMFQLPAVALFSVSSGYTTLGQRWEKWIQSLEFYLVLSEKSSFTSFGMNTGDTYMKQH